ncbi:hypothetical protein FACS1894206_09460 [Deltaproteobacteria bacterium]|nr:hypothetical protein FACS1894206_09460 [Deltaproteobacteria bacterium]
MTRGASSEGVDHETVTGMELTGQAHVLAGRSYRYIEVYLAVGCCYLALTTAASALLGRLEKNSPFRDLKLVPDHLPYTLTEKS